jgi:hypothetical protein
MGPRLAALIDASPTFPVIEPRQRPTTIRALVSRAHVRRALAPRPGGLAVAEHAPDVVGTWSDLGSGLDHQAFRWRSRRARHRSRRVRRGHPERGCCGCSPGGCRSRARAAVRRPGARRARVPVAARPARSWAAPRPRAPRPTYGCVLRSCTPSTRPPSRFRLRRPTRGSGWPNSPDTRAVAGAARRPAAAHRRAGARPPPTSARSTSSHRPDTAAGVIRLVRTPPSPTRAGLRAPLPLRPRVP